MFCDQDLVYFDLIVVLYYLLMLILILNVLLSGIIFSWFSAFCLKDFDEFIVVWYFLIVGGNYWVSQVFNVQW